MTLAPSRLTRRLLPALVCALLLAPGCTNVSADGNPFPPGSREAELHVCVLDGKPISLVSMAARPNFRAQMIQLRDIHLSNALIDREFAQAGLTYDTAFADWALDITLATQLPPTPGKTPREVLADQTGIGTERWPWDEFLVYFHRQFKLIALVTKDDPIDHEDLVTQFNMIPRDQLLQMFGPQKGWTTPEQVSLDPIEQEIRQILYQQTLQQQDQSYRASLREKALADGTLVIHHLPNEGLHAALTEAFTQGLGSQEAVAYAEANAEPDPPVPVGDGGEPGAYTLDGKLVLWGDLFLDPFIRYNTAQISTTLIQQLAIETLFADLGEPVSPKLLGWVRQSQGMTDPDSPDARVSALQNFVQGEEATRVHEWEAKFTRLVELTFPIDEAELRTTYQTQGETDGDARQRWYSAYGPVLKLNSPEEATFARMRDELYRSVLFSKAQGPQRQEMLESAISTLVNDGRLVMKGRVPEVKTTNQGLPKIAPAPFPVGSTEAEAAHAAPTQALGHSVPAEGTHGTDDGHGH